MHTKEQLLAALEQQGPQCIVLDTRNASEQEPLFRITTIAAYAAGLCRMGPQHAWVLHHLTSDAARGRWQNCKLSGEELALFLKLVGHGYKEMPSTITDMFGSMRPLAPVL